MPSNIYHPRKQALESFDDYYTKPHVIILGLMLKNSRDYFRSYQEYMKEEECDTFC